MAAPIKSRMSDYNEDFNLDDQGILREKQTALEDQGKSLFVVSCAVFIYVTVCFISV